MSLALYTLLAQKPKKCFCCEQQSSIKEQILAFVYSSFIYSFILSVRQMQHLMLDCCFKFPISFNPASLYLATTQDAVWRTLTNLIKTESHWGDKMPLFAFEAPSINSTRINIQRVRLTARTSQSILSTCLENLLHSKVVVLQRGVCGDRTAWLQSKREGEREMSSSWHRGRKQMSLLVLMKSPIHNHS